MASPQQPSLYPQIDPTNPNPDPTPLYPTIDMSDINNLFPDSSGCHPNPSSPVEQILFFIPGAVLHLIDGSRSIELASGDFTVVSITQGPAVLAVLARVSNSVQWPLALDGASVRLDDSHYFFSLHVPDAADPDESVINYGLTFASKGQEDVLGELDRVLERYSCFSVQSVAVSGEVLEGLVAKGTGPAEVVEKKRVLEREALAYWTTLAPNVEDYSSLFARLFAKGSGKVVKGILWCGDVTSEQLRLGNEFLKGKIVPNEKAVDVSQKTMKRIRRVKKLTKMSEQVATEVLSGVIKVSGFFTSTAINSKAGKKFFGLLPGEIVLASLDGFAKICDAAEVAGKTVLSTSSSVTTELVCHRYGEKAAEATHEGLHAAGHAIMTAWAVFKIRKALNPKGAMKPTSVAIAKAAALEVMNMKKK